MKRAKRILLWTVAVLLGLHLLLWLSGTTYLYKTVWYQHPDIHDRNIFPYRTIAPDSAAEDWPLSTEYNSRPLSPRLDSMLTAMKTVAYLVIRQDSVVHEEYRLGYHKDSSSNSFSMAKSIISALVGIALEQGCITTLDDPVALYLPDFKEGPKQFITIRHLLQMSSGLNFSEKYSSPINHTTEAYYGTDLAGLIRRLKVAEEPGKRYIYKSGDTQILELVLEQATGMSTSAYAGLYLWSRIGTEHPAYWNLDQRDGHEKGYCCFYSTARDYARFGNLYLKGGYVGGQQVVPAWYVSRSLQPSLLPNEDDEPVDYYGYQWWMERVRGHHVYYARGLKGQYIVLVPDLKLIMVRLGHERHPDKKHHHTLDFWTYVEETIDLFGPPSDLVEFNSQSVEH